MTGLTPYTLYGVQMLAVTVANGVPSVQFNVTSGEAGTSIDPAGQGNTDHNLPISKSLNLSSQHFV